MLGQRHFQPYPAEIPGAGGSGPAAVGITTTLVFRPAGVDAGNVFTTWAGIAAHLVPGTLVYVDCAGTLDGLAHVTADTGSTDCTGVVIAAYHTTSDSSPTQNFDTLVVDDGANLFRATRFTGFLAVLLDSRTTPGLSYVDSGPDTDNILLETSALAMTTTATIAGIQVDPGGTFAIQAWLAILGQPGTVPLLSIGASASVAVEAFDNTVCDPDFVSSVVPSVFEFFHDASVPYQVFPGLGAGTDNDKRVDLEAWLLPNAGSSADAPVAPFVAVGERYFNTDRNSEFCFDGTAYVGPTFFGNCTGAAPVITPGPATGTGGGAGAGLSAGSTDTAGRMLIVAGATGLAPGVLATVAFTSPLPQAPRSVVFAPANANAAGGDSGIPTVFTASVSGVNFTLNITNSLDPGLEYEWWYLVLPGAGP